MRNSDRLGLNDLNPVPEQPEPSDPMPVNQGSTDLGFPQPTNLVELPTEGRFYPEGHVLHNVRHIEIRDMTAKDEEILASKTLVANGTALDKMLQGLIVNKNIKLEDLFLGDKGALVLAARINAYGNEYNTHVTCPSCGTRTSHTFDLEEIKAKKDHLDELSDFGTFEVVLPKSKRKVSLKLLNGADEKAMKELSNKKKRHKLPESPLMDLLKTIIVSVDDNESRDHINDFLESLTARDSQFIRGEYASRTPDLDLTHGFECSTCGTFSRIRIPFTGNFFWPN